MLSVAEAMRLVLDRATARPPVDCALDAALGLMLAEDVDSDVDSPPHDKSLVDGYALVAADVVDGAADLEILEEVTAGLVPSKTVARGQATRVMTGAPLPDGADAVVMVEQTEVVANGSPLGRVKYAGRAVAGQNIMRRATSIKRGDRVLDAGSEIGPIEIGILAEVGRARVMVVPRPSLAVLSTGNELVPVEQPPGPGQIRNSNGPMLVASASAAGAKASDLGIARDELASLQERISQGLASDVLVLSGGVSAGVLDLVPSVLASLGVEQVFHKVHLKPGKPIWFGVHTRDGREHLVFGLPGNPVGSLVCFELFVRPAIASLAGRHLSGEVISLPLAADFAQRGDRPTYFPSRIAEINGRETIKPLRWHGSGDLRALAAANALACFPAGERQFKVGETIKAFRLPR